MKFIAKDLLKAVEKVNKEAYSDVKVELRTIEPKAIIFEYMTNEDDKVTIAVVEQNSSGWGTITTSKRF